MHFLSRTVFEWSDISRETYCQKRLKPQYYLCLNYKNKGSFPKNFRESINKGLRVHLIRISILSYWKETLNSVWYRATIQNSHQDLYQDNVRSNNVSIDRIRALRVGLNGRKSLKRYIALQVSLGIWRMGWYFNRWLTKIKFKF